MAIQPTVNFELYWRGPYKQDKWDFGSVRLHFFDTDVLGNFNKNIVSSNEQRLTIGTFEWQEPNYTLACSPRMAKTIKISISTFHLEPPSIKSGAPLRVVIDARPEFESGQTYQIKLEHTEGKIQATIKRKVNVINVVKNLFNEAYGELNRSDKRDVQKCCDLKVTVLQYYKDLVCQGVSEASLPPLYEDMLAGYQLIKPDLEDKRKQALKLMEPGIKIKDSVFLRDDYNPDDSSLELSSDDD